jgi:hypothetical protein
LENIKPLEIVSPNNFIWVDPIVGEAGDLLAASAPTAFVKGPKAIELE